MQLQKQYSTNSKNKTCVLLFAEQSQTCDRALSDLQNPVSDGSSRQQVDIVCRTQHDVL